MTGTPERRPSEAQSPDSRLRILEAAAAIAAEAGYEGTTISKITKRSGLPVSSVYWFFKDKDELLVEVVAHSFDDWLSRQAPWDPLPDGVPLADGLTAILSTAVRSLPDAPDFLRIGHLLALETRETEPAARRRFLEIRDEVEQRIADWFTAELDPGMLRDSPELPRRLAQLIIASTDGLFLAHQIHEVWDPDEFVGLIVDTVQSAVTAARGSDPGRDERSARLAATTVPR